MTPDLLVAPEGGLPPPSEFDLSTFLPVDAPLFAFGGLIRLRVAGDCELTITNPQLLISEAAQERTSFFYDWARTLATASPVLEALDSCKQVARSLLIYAAFGSLPTITGENAISIFALALKWKMPEVSALAQQQLLMHALHAGEGDQAGTQQAGQLFEQLVTPCHLPISPRLLVGIGAVYLARLQEDGDHGSLASNTTMQPAIAAALAKMLSGEEAHQ